MTGNEAIEQFMAYLLQHERSQKTLIGYQSDLLGYQRYYETHANVGWIVEQTQTEDLEAYLQYIKLERHLKAGTYNRILYGFRSFFRFCTRKGICPHNIAEPLESIRYSRPERRIPDTQELESFIRHIERPLMQMVAWTLFYSGLRIAECLHLTMGDVDFAHRQILVRQGKGNKDRIVPLAEKLYPLLWSYRQEFRSGASETERFFATEASGQLSSTLVNKVFHETSERMKRTNPVTAHQFRHCFATTLLRNGANLVEVQRILGHSSLNVTSVYLHHTLEDLSKAVNRL